MDNQKNLCHPLIMIQTLDSKKNLCHPLIRDSDIGELKKLIKNLTIINY